MVTQVIKLMAEAFFYGRKCAPVRCKYVANSQKKRVQQIDENEDRFDLRAFFTRGKNLVYDEEIFHNRYDQRISHYRIKAIICEERCKVTNPRTRNVGKGWNEIDDRIKGYIE